MTIINHTSDGLYPEVIALFRAVAYTKQITPENLITVCFPPIEKASEDEIKNKKKEMRGRLSGALSRWTELGLFTEADGKVQLQEQFSARRKESIDMLTERLPSFCRQLILQDDFCIPLWGESGLTSDFARGVAWILAQDIYKFPSIWNVEKGSGKPLDPLKYVEILQNHQCSATVIQNGNRWNDLRFWTRYLGFASGDSATFQIDPTVAVREALPSIFGAHKELPAKDFLLALASRLPVLDFGNYRKEVENALNETYWRKPSEGHLSMSLSFALRRLDLEKTIRLLGKADTGSSYRLTGRNYRTWLGFETVAWKGGKA